MMTTTMIWYRAIEETATGAHDRPLADVVIADCGIVEAPKEAKKGDAVNAWSGCKAVYRT